MAARPPRIPRTPRIPRARRRRPWAIALHPAGRTVIAAALAAIAPVAARAQDTGDFLGSDIPFDLRHGGGTTVIARPHPELDPIGVRVGTAWLLLPAISTGVGFTDNVYGATIDRVGDGFVTLTPQATLTSQWSRHFLELTGSAALKRFFSQTTRSETAYQVAADGRYDLGTGDSNLYALVSREHGFEEQYSGDFPQNAAGTVAYDQTQGIVRGTFVFNRLRLIANERLNDLRYADTTSLAGGLIGQHYRDRTEYRSAARVEFAFNPDVSTFTEVSYATADYHHATPGQPLRSNHDMRVLVGANFDLDTLVRAMIGVGYARRRYDLAYYPAIGGVSVDARIEWLPTELTTVNLQASRKIEDAITVSSPGYFADVAQIHIDHELLRYVLLFVEGTYEHDSYVAITRRDTEKQVRAGATYALSRHFKLRPSVWYITRSTSGLPTGQAFNEVRGTVDLFTQW